MALSMKYLEVPSLDEVSMALTDRELGIVTVNGAIHLYSFPSRKGKHNVKVENENFAVNPNDQMRRAGNRSSSLDGDDSVNKSGATSSGSRKNPVTPSPRQWATATLSSEKPGTNSKSPLTIFAGAAGAASDQSKASVLRPKIAVAMKGPRRRTRNESRDEHPTASGSSSVSSDGNSSVKKEQMLRSHSGGTSYVTGVKVPVARSRSDSSHSRSASIGSLGGDEFPSRRSRSTSIGGCNDANSGVLTSEGRPGKSRSMSLGDWSNQNSAHRILLELTSTLNESFPDYDFSQAKTSSFVVFTVDTVIRTVNNYFSDLQNEEDPKFLENLWAALDTEVKLSRCEVYSYVPDMDGDPFSEESIWSFNYFFIDRELRKIAYFTCVACTTLHKDADASDYQTDSDAGNRSPVSPSPDVYGFYGSPTRTSTVSDSEEHSPRDHNIAMQEEESDSDEMA